MSRKIPPIWGFTVRFMAKQYYVQRIALVIRLSNWTLPLFLSHFDNNIQIYYETTVGLDKEG